MFPGACDLWLRIELMLLGVVCGKFVGRLWERGQTSSTRGTLIDGDGPVTGHGHRARLRMSEILDGVLG
jgi:hypothetical protein